MVKISRDLRFRIKNLFIHFSRYVHVSRSRAEKINSYFHLPSRKIRERVVVEKLLRRRERSEIVVSRD